MRHYLAAFMAIAVFLIPWVGMTYQSQITYIWNAADQEVNQLAAVILARHAKSAADIAGKYQTVTDGAPVSTKKVRILLVPGHEPDFGGAEYGSLKERNMTVELAQDLQQFLSSDPHYQVFITRDTQSWNPIFSDYFKTEWDAITSWEQASHDAESQLVKLGEVTQSVSSVFHNNAPHDVALRLYGITKWANENDIDIMVHIHFNDYPNHAANTPGKYTGFAIYVPAEQYGNSSSTKAIADTVFKRLSEYNPVSNLPGESAGIVDEPDLIALGSNNTSDAASMLIEYGYLYEQQFQDPTVRTLALKDMAYQTYLGLEDFFQPQDATRVAHSYDTLALPHSWANPITEKNTIGPDVFALQTALHADGDYPPTDMTQTDCPRTGKFGPCTQQALIGFQRKYGVFAEKGIVGTTTMAKLNELFSF